MIYKTANIVLHLSKLFKPLTKSEMKKIVGGYPQDDGGGGNCKTSTATCQYYTVSGNAYSGKCSTIPPTGMSNGGCGCKYGDLTQPASKCDQPIAV